MGGGLSYLPLTEAASSPMYKKSTRLQWCACTPAFMRAKIRIPSPFLHAHSGLLASPVAPSRFEAAVMAELILFSPFFFFLISPSLSLAPRLVWQAR